MSIPLILYFDKYFILIISASCQACHVELRSKYENNTFSLYINNVLIGEASGLTKSEAKNAAGVIAWNVCMCAFFF